MNDPYATLGLNRGATEDEVKAAYKKLAMQFHPDRNTAPEASARMAEINAAYDAIRNPQPQPQHHHHHQGNPYDFFRHSTGMPPDFEDIFGSFFHHGQRRNNDIQTSYSIRLEDAFTGVNFAATLPDGRTVQARIPPGVEDGTRMRVPHGGERGIPNMPPGDLYITVRVLSHPVFRRQGDHLYAERQIDAIDAILGTAVEVDLLDGQRMRVSVPPGSQHGTALRVGDHGMPVMNGGARRGSLFVVVNLTVPRQITPAQRKALEGYRAL